MPRSATRTTGSSEVLSFLGGGGIPVQNPLPASRYQRDYTGAPSHQSVINVPTIVSNTYMEQRLKGAELGFQSSINAGVAMKLGTPPRTFIEAGVLPLPTGATSLKDHHLGGGNSGIAQVDGTPPTGATTTSVPATSANPAAVAGTAPPTAPTAATAVPTAASTAAPTAASTAAPTAASTAAPTAQAVVAPTLVAPSLPEGPSNVPKLAVPKGPTTTARTTNIAPQNQLAVPETPPKLRRARAQDIPGIRTQFVSPEQGANAVQNTPAPTPSKYDEPAGPSENAPSLLGRMAKAVGDRLSKFARHPLDEPDEDENEDEDVDEGESAAATPAKGTFLGNLLNRFGRHPLDIIDEDEEDGDEGESVAASAAPAAGTPKARMSDEEERRFERALEEEDRREQARLEKARRDQQNAEAAKAKPTLAAPEKKFDYTFSICHVHYMQYFQSSCGRVNSRR